MSERMRRWVITGPTGSGKSLLADFLAQRGAVVISGDAIGHALLRIPEVIDMVRRAFGDGVLREAGIDRRKLGRLVFGDSQALARLGAITHPRLAAAVRQQFAELEAGGRTRLAVLEAAVYYLLPSLEAIDLTIAVLASEEVRLARLVAGGRLTDQEARQRLIAQRPLECYWSRADLVLVNEGTPQQFLLAAQRALEPHWSELARDHRSN